MKHTLAGAALCFGLLSSAASRAASLQQLDPGEWWGDVTGLPTYVTMYFYVPDQRAEHPPVVVAPHHCQGTGPGTYSEMSDLVSLADQNGFIIIFPEATGQNCWDAGSDRSLQHDGKGDTHAIVQMVRYVLSTYDGNAARVYSVGGSSGGIMTEALLGVYPDVFTAGVSLMGVPCGCWAEGYNDVVGQPSNGTGQWSGPCAAGDVTHTPEEWGSLVRSYFPGYSGHRPRLQHWHGTADTVLDYANVAEDIKEWTNVLGLTESPTGTDTPSSGTTRQYWTSPSCDFTVYEVFSLSGIGHSVPFDANAVAAYFGLDDVAGEDPETAACPGAVPGGSGSGGEAGAGGAGRGGGSGVSGSAAAAGGAVGGAAGDANGGADPATAGSVRVTGGAGSDGGSGVTGGTTNAATGGLAPTGGAVATGGSAGGGGDTVAAGGVLGTGGSTSGSGGTQGPVSGAGGTQGAPSGGTAGTGAEPASAGGTAPTGGTRGPAATGVASAGSGVGGSSIPGSGGSYPGVADVTGATTGLGGAPAGPASSAGSGSGSDGCGCWLARSDSRAPTPGMVSWIAVGILLARRRRGRP